MPHDPIRRHIAAIGSRPESESRRMAEDAVRACWPTGVEDRTDRMARGWLRHWRPARATAPIRACTCAAGRCAVCN